MKTILVLSILFCAIVLPARGELTDSDLDKIRLIVKEEVKTEITASEKRTREYIDLKINGVEKSLNARIDGLDQKIDDTNEPFDPFWIVMIIMLTAIILPQIIILYKERNDQKEMQAEVQQLRERLEALENASS